MADFDCWVFVCLGFACLVTVSELFVCGVLFVRECFNFGCDLVCMYAY